MGDADGMIRFEEALALAAEKHAGQIDYGGSPHLEHIIRVAENFEGEEKIIAVLHDIVEDCDVTPEYLARQGVPSGALETLAALTRDRRFTYEEYIRRLAANPAARRIKLADLKDNITRLYFVPEPKKSRLFDRYIPAYNFLTSIREA